MPGFVLPFLAHPLVAGSIYLVALSILFLHGLFIWQDAFQRVVAILVGVVILAMTYRMVRKGTFTRRLVIEVRQDVVLSGQEAGGMFSVTDSGRAATQAQVWLSYPDGERFYQTANGTIPHFSNLCSLKIQVPMVQAQELLIWVHRVTPEGQSESLPAHLKVTSGKEIRDVQVDGVRQQLVLPLLTEEKKESKGRPDEIGQVDVEVQLATAAVQEN